MDKNRNTKANMTANDANTINEILTAKADAGPDAYLWVHTSGDCILWPDEDASENDDGAKAIGRWQLNSGAKAALVDSGEVDEIC